MNWELVTTDDPRGFRKDLFNVTSPPGLSTIEIAFPLDSLSQVEVGFARHALVEMIKIFTEDMDTLPDRVPLNEVAFVRKFSEAAINKTQGELDRLNARWPEDTIGWELASAKIQ